MKQARVIVHPLASLIRNAAQAGPSPFVMAIDGRSGVGKSTLARSLAADLDATVIEGDDFYAGGVTLRHDPPEVLAQVCVDWQRLKDTLACLLATGHASYHPFDWARFDGSLSQTVTHLTAKPFIIVEGVYSARPELRPMLNMTVLAVADDDKRMARLEHREGPLSDWERQWHRAEDYYFERTLQPEDFDQVIQL